MRTLAGMALSAIGAAYTYSALVRGALTLDLGVGRRTRPLGPQRVRMEAPRETVFEVVAQPYLGRATRAMREKVEVLERGEDMVLAAHYTPVSERATTTTVETVRFDPPERVSFRLVRGPVPHVVETFELHERDGATELVYEGELGTDLWRLGELWGTLVARSWERTVAESLEAVRVEAERRASRAGARA